MSSRTRLPWVGVAAKHSVLWDRSLSMLDGRDHSSHSICPGKYRIQKFGSTQKNEMWRGWRNVWNNILIAECELYNCCHHLRGLRTGDRAKLDNPEASSYPNESSCLSHSTEFNLCPLLLLPFSPCHYFLPSPSHQLLAWPVCKVAPHHRQQLIPQHPLHLPCAGSLYILMPSAFIQQLMLCFT